MRFFILLLPVLLAGCGEVIAPKPGDQTYAPVTRQDTLPPVLPTGSLYQRGRAQELFSDARARNIGDILTVSLQESTQAQKSATSNSSKSSSASITAPIIGGIVPTLGGKTLSAEFGDNGRQFNGSGTAAQSNSLSGQISVMVVDRLPGGVLRISGEKWLELNQGKEYIRLTGMVREQDIATDNTIVSTKIADAQIAYSGTGVIGNANRPGWLARFFNSPIWPF